MLSMQTTTGNGKIYGKVTTIQSMGALGPLIINGKTVVNTRHIAPLNIPGTVSMKEGLLEKLAEDHYKITPFRGEKVTATIFNKNYTGALIELNGEVVIVDGVQMTNGSTVKPAAESPKARPLLSDTIQPPKQTITEASKASPDKSHEESVTSAPEGLMPIKMQAIAGDGKIHGNVSITMTGVQLPGSKLILPGNAPKKTETNLPTVENGKLINFGKCHYKITPTGEDKEATATIFGKQYIGASIEVNGKVVSVNGVPKTDENGVGLTSESKTEQADKPSASLATLIRNMDIRHQINPLHKAAADNKTDVIENLINQNTPVDCETDRKWTPLHYATFRGHVEATRLLVEKGASIEKVSREGNTPLQHAMDFAQRHQDAESQGKFLEIKNIIETHASLSKKKADLSPSH